MRGLKKQKQFAQTTTPRTKQQSRGFHFTLNDTVQVYLEVRVMYVNVNF